MSKAQTAYSDIKGAEMTNVKKNSNKKTNGLIQVQNERNNKYVTHKQTTTTELQAPNLEQTHSYIMWRG